MRKKNFHKVKLHGCLTKFATEVELTASDTKDLMQGLCNILGKEFRDCILNGSWFVKTDNGNVNEHTLEFPLETMEVDIFPAVQGAGKGGVGEILLGVTLLLAAVLVPALSAGFTAAMGAAEGAAVETFAASFSATFGTINSTLAMAGALSIAGGILQMTSASMGLTSYNQNAQSYVFQGGVNNTRQGVAVPVVYGITMTGSTVIYAGIKTNQIPVQNYA